MAMQHISEFTEKFFNLEQGSITEKEKQEEEMLGEELTPSQEAEYEYAWRHNELTHLLEEAPVAQLEEVFADIDPKVKGEIWQILQELKAD